MTGPARREQGDEAILLSLTFDKIHAKALVDTGASDCFMAAAFRAELPDSCIQDAWRVDKGEISLANNSSQTILQQVRVRCKLAESTVYYEFKVVDSLCHNIVIGRNLLTVLRSVVSLPGGGIEVFCGNPISSCEKVPPGNECIIPVVPWHPVEPSEESIYCSPTVTAPVIVEGCINVPGCVWRLKVLNPLEETQEITVNDVLGFTEECIAPDLAEEEIEEFLDLEYLKVSDVPIALCQIAVDVMKDLTSITPLDEEDEKTPSLNDDGNEISDEERIQNIDLSESCLNDEQKQVFRTMLLKNRQSLAFLMKELGQCEIAPMKIKVEESQGIVNSRPSIFTTKIDIIDEQVKQLIEIGVFEPSESAWRSPQVVVQKKA